MNQIVILVTSGDTILWQLAKPFATIEEAFGGLDQLREEASRRIAVLFVQALQNELKQRQDAPAPAPAPAE